MNLSMLVVDSNVEVSSKEQAEWQRHGISTVRVDTMQEAIEKLNRDNFLFTAINADSVNYLPLLELMREISSSPIFIISSSFTLRGQVEALHHGADAYASFQDSTAENVLLALALLQSYHERDRQPRKPVRILSCGSIFVVPAFRRVFIGDKEIVLTKQEFDLLCLLMGNRGLIFSHEQILRNVWGEEYTDADSNVLWCQMRRLREKLSPEPDVKDYIKTVRGIGYRFEPTDPQ